MIRKTIWMFALGLALAVLTPTICEAHAAWMTPAAQMQLGRDAMRHHDWSDAVDHFRQAVALDYHSSEAHCDLGYAYLHRGDIERARWQFQEDLRLHADCKEAVTGLHLTFQDESDRDAYLAQLRQEAANNPKNADAVASVAEELFDRGRPDEATQLANQALVMQPGLGHAHCVLGHIALSRGDTATARTELEAAIKGDRNDDDAWGALGDIAMSAGDYDTAVEDYRHAADAFPQHREWHTKLADAYDKRGDARAAGHERSIIAGLTEPMPETANSR